MKTHSHDAGHMTKMAAMIFPGTTGQRDLV